MFTDRTQSFTAQLFVDNKPIATVRKVINKLLEEPDTGEGWHEFHRNARKDDPLELSYSEGVTPETFYFAYHDDVYTIRIKGVNSLYQATASMEGAARNLSIFEGDDPTYFRIINSSGNVVKMDEIPDAISEIYLYAGPQRRPVKSYSGPPTFPVLTDNPSRIGTPLVFKLKIIERNPSDASWL